MRRFRSRPALSFVVVAYGMSRELPRTLFSLSRSYQGNVKGLDYDVLVVDNGSPKPVDRSMVEALGFRLHRIEPAPASPAYAANVGVAMTRGHHVGLILDGARMVTPGVVSMGMRAMTLHPRPVITTMAWHLGKQHQSLSIPMGYGPDQEDALLDSIEWPSNGYRLFDIAALAGANPDGFFGQVNESCCLLLPRALWGEVGGLDEAFDLPAGGLVSLDMFSRLVALPDSQLVVLLGEGSFHQVHGSASTSPGADHVAWHAQYQSIRGRPYEQTRVQPVYCGTMLESATRWITP